MENVFIFSKLLSFFTLFLGDTLKYIIICPFKWFCFLLSSVMYQAFQFFLIFLFTGVFLLRILCKVCIYFFKEFYFPLHNNLTFILFPRDIFSVKVLRWFNFFFFFTFVHPTYDCNRQKFWRKKNINFILKLFVLRCSF